MPNAHSSLSSVARLLGVGVSDAVALDPVLPAMLSKAAAACLCPPAGLSRSPLPRLPTLPQTELR
eukprot:9007722-Alexandrium_andersonii.AAC.1